MQITLSGVNNESLPHSIVATICYTEIGWWCPYCSVKQTGIFYRWFRRKIGKAQTTYTACCEDCAVVEGET